MIPSDPSRTHRGPLLSPCLQVLIGTALNAEPLSKRHKLVFTRSVTLKPNVAHALLVIGGADDRSKALSALIAFDCLRGALKGIDCL